MSYIREAISLCTDVELREKALRQYEIQSRIAEPLIKVDDDIHTWNAVVACGLQQEMNRQFLHPIGFDLRFREDGYPIMHYTTDKEGYLLAEVDKTKRIMMEIIVAARHKNRRTALGYVIQP